MDEDKPLKRKDKTPEQALSSLMRLCSRAEKSSGDAMRLMRTWNVDPSARQEVLCRLTAHGFIDDRRYADAYIRDKTNLVGWGIHKIERQLFAKGVSREIIDDALSSLDRGKQSDRLEKMLLRKLHSIKAATGYELRAKLFRYAAGLGYDYDDVASAVEKAVKGASNHAE